MMHHTLKRKQAGLSLLEATIALGVMSAIFIGINELTSRYSEDTRAMIASQHLRQVGEAAQPYIRDNYAALESVATNTTPALITVPMLSATGYLQNGYSTTNGYGQAACVLVLKPSPGRLSALVVSEAFNATQQLDDITLAQVAAAVGASGGGVYSTAPTELIGTMAGWRTPIGAFANANATGVRCDGATPGAVQVNAGQPVMALWFEQGDTSSSFLYRDEVPGRPDLNTMNTPILMSNAMAQTVGDLCTTVGALSRDVSGAVVSCQGGTWKRQGSEFWQDGVANFSNLPACNVNSQGHTRVVRNAADGAARPRAYTCYGTAWRPLGLDNNGNLTVPGTVIAGAVNASGRVTSNDMVTKRVYDADNTGYYVDPASTSRLNYANIDGAQINAVATENAGCSPNGRIARTSAGTLLSCQSGRWVSTSFTEAAFVQVYRSNVSLRLLIAWDGDIQRVVSNRLCARFAYPNYPSCPAGSTAVAYSRSTNHPTCDADLLYRERYSYTTCRINGY